MGVTVDKSRGNTVVEGVSVKNVSEGGSAALAKSPRGVGLKLGMYNVVEMVLIYSEPLVVTMQQKRSAKAFILAGMSYTTAAYHGVSNIRAHICRSYFPGMDEISVTVYRSKSIPTLLHKPNIWSGCPPQSVLDNENKEEHTEQNDSGPLLGKESQYSTDCKLRFTLQGGNKGTCLLYSLIIYLAI